ncbi:hypothetical protein F5887DRAFT_425872 [Amanita rubescens]|nr:hypothetical protein F5887DRAFT_425872 [Amanita rubescens]
MIIPSRPSSPSPSLDVPQLRRHSRYYLPNGNVIFRVADVLFRVTDEPLRSNSKAFARQFLPNHIPFGTCVGTDDAPIVIDGVEPYEFDRFLGVICPPFHRHGSSFFADYGLTEWLMVLDLADLWGFYAIYNYALHHIITMNMTHPLTYLDIARLSERYPLPLSWRLEAIKHLVGREEPLSVEEAKDLGENLTVWVFTTREILGEKGRQKEDLIEYVISEIFDMIID